MTETNYLISQKKSTVHSIKTVEQKKQSKHLLKLFLK